MRDHSSNEESSLTKQEEMLYTPPKVRVNNEKP